MTAALNRVCGYGQRKPVLNPKWHNAERCAGVTLLPPATFFPFSWLDGALMSNGKLDGEWEKDFERSMAVHFSQSSLGGGSKVLKPRHYGKKRPALLYLAVRFCPISFDSVKIF